jgi:cation transport ATPase
VKKQLFEQLLRLNPAERPEADLTNKTNTNFPVGEWLEPPEGRNLRLRFAVAAFLCLIIFALNLCADYFEHISGGVHRYVPFVLLALASPVVSYCGYPILRVGWNGLRNRTLGMESLLSIGVLTAYFYSAAQSFRGASLVHFDVASVIVTFALACKSIEWDAKQRTSRWVTLLHRLAPNEVRLLSENKEHFVSVDALRPGQLFLVKVGERFPNDGSSAE